MAGTDQPNTGRLGPVRLEGSLADLPAVVWSTDRALTLTDARGIGIPHAGIMPGDLPGTSLAALVGAGPADVFARRALAGETIRYETSHGGYILEHRQGPTRDASGTIVGTLGITLDVTDAVREIQRLRRLTAGFQDAERIGQLGHWDLDIATGRLDWSGQIYEIFGVDRMAFGASYEAFFSFVHPDDRERMGRAQAAALAGQADLDLQHRIVRPDGTVRFVHERAALIRDETGRPLRLTGTVHDVTDRAEAENHIRRLNRVHRLLSRINQTVVRSLEPGDMLTAACVAAVDIGGFTLAWVGLKGGSGTPLSLSAHAGASRETLDGLAEALSGSQAGHTAAADVASSARPLVCHDTATDKRVAGWPDVLAQPCGSVAVLPLLAAGTTYGAITLCADAPGFFDSDEMELLAEVAADLGFALAAHQHDVERRRASDALRDSQARLAESLAELRTVSRRLLRIKEGERRRIARELHDHLGQALTSLTLDIAEVRRLLQASDGPAIEARLDDMALLIRRCIEEVHQVISELRPPVLDQLGLVDAIAAYLEDLNRRTSVACRLVRRPEELAVPEDHALALFRILQEAVTNAIRHADATRIEVALGLDGATVRLEVRDNGRGIPPPVARPERRMGLTGMRDRARLLGGQVAVTGAPGQGTIVAATLPLEEATS